MEKGILPSELPKKQHDSLWLISSEAKLKGLRHHAV
jgi:hypothetical protein